MTSEGFPMDAIVSAALGDIINRSISFFVDKYRSLPTGGAEESLQHLRCVLLRAQTTVGEAERHVTNQAMLRQLDALRHDMYRGYYALDVFACRGHDDAGAKHQVSKLFSSAKRLYSSTGWKPNKCILKERRNSYLL
jgi:hypothetical protein